MMQAIPEVLSCSQGNLECEQVWKFKKVNIEHVWYINVENIPIK